MLGAAVGAAVAALTELLLVRRLYNRHIEQVLVTVGLAVASVALFEGIWGTDPTFITGPEWLPGPPISPARRCPTTASSPSPQQ